MSNILEEKEIISYKLLWVHIIKQAYRDMKEGRSYKVRREAFRYIFVPNKYFAIASDMIGVHPIKLRERLVNAFLENKEI